MWLPPRNIRKTLHYRGEGIFMISGPSISLRKEFNAENL
jgi:hypothetical protein